MWQDGLGAGEWRAADFWMRRHATHLQMRKEGNKDGSGREGAECAGSWSGGWLCGS